MLVPIWKIGLKREQGWVAARMRLGIRSLGKERSTSPRVSKNEGAPLPLPPKIVVMAIAAEGDPGAGWEERLKAQIGKADLSCI